MERWGCKEIQTVKGKATPSEPTPWRYKGRLEV